ncbi:pyridoxamine 5'-phosphate oxidase family protein [Arthrobacter sp. SD76]|uniref:pyridoxamine 5'-phosphate oxidase family protein n=1 Tax=Arthrobacter sp. SD76 TaxID=3415007 RepID=UPI003C71876C
MNAEPASTEEPSSAVQNLEHHECWAMLRTVSVGRLAIVVDGRPDIFPINYTVDGGTVVFRTGEGTKLSGASGDSAVALEADGVDPSTGMAWSVVLKGTSAVVRGTEEVLDTARLYLFPWQAGHKDAFVRITPDSVTGRRFKVTDPLTWWTQHSSAAKSWPE